MKNLVIAAAGLLTLLGGWPVAAADIAVLKAPPRGFFETSGWYVGLGTLAVTTNSEITIPEVGTTGKITTAGAGIGPVAGYHKGTVASFWMVEGALYWQNLGGSQAITGADVHARFSGSGRVKIGGTNLIANLGKIIPGNLDLTGLGGVLPAPVVGQGNMPYVSVGFNVARVGAQLAILGLEESDKLQITPAIGMGFMSQIMDATTGRPTRCATDTSVEYTPAGKGHVIGGEGNVNLGRQFTARFAVLC